MTVIIASIKAWKGTGRQSLLSCLLLTSWSGTCRNPVVECHKLNQAVAALQLLNRAALLLKQINTALLFMIWGHWLGKCVLFCSEEKQFVSVVNRQQYSFTVLPGHCELFRLLLHYSMKKRGLSGHPVVCHIVVIHHTDDIMLIKQDSKMVSVLEALGGWWRFRNLPLQERVWRLQWLEVCSDIFSKFLLLHPLPQKGSTVCGRSPWFLDVTHSTLGILLQLRWQGRKVANLEWGFELCYVAHKMQQSLWCWKCLWWEKMQQHLSMLSACSEIIRSQSRYQTWT